jgi:hypothetical protein
MNNELHCDKNFGNCWTRQDEIYYELQKLIREKQEIEQRIFALENEYNALFDQDINICD